MKKRRAARGFTLAELLIALLLSVFILTGTVGILAPVAGTAADLREYAEMNRLLDTLSGGLTADLAQAMEVQLPAMGPPGSKLKLMTPNGPLFYAVDEGILCRKFGDDEPSAEDDAVYNPAYYNGKRIELECTREAADRVKVTIRIKSAEDTHLIERAYVVRPPVLAARGSTP